MSYSFHVIIAGGGVIGASIAWRLARENRRVLLLDAHKVGSEASSAAAGMLAPGGEFDQSEMLDFATASFRLYPDFIHAIESDSGLPTEFRRTGAVEIALTDAELSNRPGAVEIDRAQLRALAPLVRPDAIGAIHYPDEAAVDPAALMKALRAACLARGVCIREDSPVTSIAAHSDRVELADATAQFAVLAAGAWSSQIAVTIASQPQTFSRSYPVKGHLLGYRLPAGSLPVTIRHGHTYVLQRADGFTIAGSSMEDAGFDRTIDSKIVSEIAARAAALVPALSSLQPESIWIGFRPAIDSPAPQIGRFASSRLWLAYGHFRNGILLAPATAARVCQEIGQEIGAALE